MTSAACSAGTRTLMRPVSSPPMTSGSTGAPVAASAATACGDLVGAYPDPHLGAPASSSSSRPCADQATPVDDAHHVRELLDLGQDVARHEDRLALVGEEAEQLPHRHDARGVEAVGRLVQQQQVGVRQERERDAQPLAHTQGVRADLVTCAVGQADRLEHLVGS